MNIRVIDWPADSEIGKLMHYKLRLGAVKILHVVVIQE